MTLPAPVPGALPDWLDALAAASRAGRAAVLVSVAQGQGSVPREAGARMLVTDEAQVGTIGGGHLEWQAAAIAREMLANDAPARRVRRLPLGPALGQCCGGVVHLSFERIAAGAADTWIAAQAAAWRQALPHLVLFGAGHVGRAVVRALAPLACALTWADARDAAFGDDVPAHVRMRRDDDLDAVVDDAPPGSDFLVMTHEHRLDLALTERILARIAARDDVGWFGLIGSQTKRAQFERRLRERGHGDAALARMTCPIGLRGQPGLDDKAPAVIAIAVAAQLLGVWQQARERADAARTHHAHG